MTDEGHDQGARIGNEGEGGAGGVDQEHGVLLDLFEVRRLPLAPLFTATGAALVIYVASELSLVLAVVVTLAVFLGVFVAGWLRMPPERRSEARCRMAVGAIAGAAGTAAYDAIRAIHVAIVDLRFQPFDILEVFGTTLVGEVLPEWVVMTAGVAFHVSIGVGMATAFTLLLRRPNVVNGTLFALVLGSFAVVIIPNWLGTEEVFLEFLAVSSLGFLVYGATVGGLSPWLLVRWRHAEGPRVVERES